MNILLNLIGVICLLPLKAYTFSYLWSWFIVSQFNLPALNILGAMGIMVLLDFIRFRTLLSDDMIRNSLTKEERTSRTTLEIVIHFIMCFSSLLIGYCLHSFM